MHSIAEHYDALAGQRVKYFERNRYYHDLLARQYRSWIPSGSTVLEVGCGTGDLLNSVCPAGGVGVDLSAHTIEVARQRFPNLNLIAGSISNLPAGATFDYIILPGTLGEADDVQALLEELLQHCHADTRMIVQYHSVLWQYLLALAVAVGERMPTPRQNWLTGTDITGMLGLAGYEVVRSDKSILLPRKIWLLSGLLNSFLGRLPMIEELTLNHFLIARPASSGHHDYSVSIVIPCRNERGNIEDAVRRIPEFGSSQEIIFVEGGSSDGTYDEVERIITAHPEKHMSVHQQTGKGKGDAVRLGFSHAQNELLMILDADLTTPPETLPKFYHAIANGKGDFINGSRLVYPMENEAMRFLNLLANKFFSVAFSWLLGQPIKDTLCGTKVILRHHYEKIAANRSYFGDFDPFGDFDLLFGATRLNLKITEVPIRYRERTYGATNIDRWRHGWLLLRMVNFAARRIKFI